MPLRAPENTLASFALALASGADGIELDVHMTADGAVVVHHDPELADGTALALVTLTELAEHESSAARGIPTLQQVCGLVKGRAELFVEIKGPGIEREVVAVLASYDGPFAIHSFDHDLIRRVSTMNTGFRLGILVDDVETDVRAAMAAAGALDAWPHYPLVTPSMVGAVHSEAGRVLPWTVNDPEEARRLVALGVDGICTDDVMILR